MKVFFVNTDAVSFGGRSRHDAWFARRVIVTGGEKRYRDALERIGAGDLVLVYVNGTGVVAVGQALDGTVLDVVSPDTVNPGEPVEYHKQVGWRLDLRASPIRWGELVELLGQGPLQAVQEVDQGKAALLRRLATLDAVPTPDMGEYLRLAAELRRHGPVERPAGVLNPQRVVTQSLQLYRDPKVRAWILQRAAGVCELCNHPAPFLDDAGERYLESHHIVSLADGGPDTPENTAAVCANCHRELHLGVGRQCRTEQLRAVVADKESTGPG